MFSPETQPYPQSYPQPQPYPQPYQQPPQSYPQPYPPPQVSSAPPSAKFQPVENFLRSLGLESCIETFRVNDFDWDTLLYFPKLSPPEQEKLIPAIGSRLKLKTAIEQYLAQNAQPITGAPPSYDQTLSSPVPPYSGKQI